MKEKEEEAGMERKEAIFIFISIIFERRKKQRWMVPFLKPEERETRLLTSSPTRDDDDDSYNSSNIQITVI
jgi:hypothetical protein